MYVHQLPSPILLRNPLLVVLDLFKKLPEGSVTHYQSQWDLPQGVPVNYHHILEIENEDLVNHNHKNSQDS